MRQPWHQQLNWWVCHCFLVVYRSPLQRQLSSNFSPARQAMPLRPKSLQERLAWMRDQASICRSDLPALAHHDISHNSIMQTNELSGHAAGQVDAQLAACSTWSTVIQPLMAAQLGPAHVASPGSILSGASPALIGCLIQVCMRLDLRAGKKGSLSKPSVILSHNW